MKTESDRVNKMKKLLSIYLKFTLQYITLTDYYIVKEQIQMMSNDSIINDETKWNRVSKMKKTVINILKIYITIYHTYQLLYCKGTHSDDE